MADQYTEEELEIMCLAADNKQMEKTINDLREYNEALQRKIEDIEAELDHYSHLKSYTYEN